VSASVSVHFAVSASISVHYQYHSTNTPYSFFLTAHEITHTLAVMSSISVDLNARRGAYVHDNRFDIKKKYIVFILKGDHNNLQLGC
jgi:hypothetical protein